MLAVRLDPILEENLNTIAKREKRTKAYYVREALTQYLEDIQDIHDAELALEDIRTGKASILSWGEVTRELTK